MANPRKLKINIVVGGRFHAAQLYQCLTTLGHDVHIYATSPARYFKKVPRDRVTFIPKPAQLIQKGLKVRAPRIVSEWSSTAFDVLVSRIMRPADVIWGFNGDSYLTARRAKARGEIYVCDRACPHILTQEALLVRESAELGYPYARQTKRTLERFLGEYALAEKIVVPSQYSARSFPKHGIEDTRVTIAPLDANAPKSAVNDADKMTFDGASETDILVGMVGGSFLRKGILYLLRAVDAMGRDDIRIVLRAHAKGILKHPEAAQLCQKLRVVFVPYLEDINRFYRSLDMFVLPSVDEGFGMVVYEALRNGTPVIATDHVGAIDVMTPGEHYLQVPAADAKRLASAISSLAEAPAKRAQLGSAGQAFYNARMQGGGHYQAAVKAIVDDLVEGRS